ncbi:MAG: AraC family transcriptional regulator [Rhodobacteraceae bacterium]|nr:AraC family transcriptional regulator [Paracoccaceae bacterium]
MLSAPTNKNRYHQRMQRVIDHINANLDDSLDLDALAGVACLSRFHWHRVYRGITGETIHSTIKRLKLNRASQQLKNTGASLKQIGRDAGYASPESFGRAFKAQLGHTPSGFRASPHTAPRPFTLKLESFATSMTTKNLKVNIRSLPELRLGVIHHTGPYNGSTAFMQLVKAAMAQSLPVGRLYGLYYDDPALTQASKLRSLAGIEIAANATPTKPLELFHTYSGCYAVFEYHGPYERLGLAYDWIFGCWFPASDEAPAEHPALGSGPINPAPLV